MFFIKRYPMSSVAKARCKMIPNWIKIGSFKLMMTLREGMNQQRNKIQQKESPLMRAYFNPSVGQSNEYNISLTTIIS